MTHDLMKSDSRSRDHEYPDAAVLASGLVSIAKRLDARDTQAREAADRTEVGTVVPHDVIVLHE